MGEGAPIQRWVQLAGYTLIIATALAVLRPFLVPLAWAAILVFATWRISERVRHALGERAALAAALMTALVVLLIVIPAVLLSLALAAEIGRTFADFRLSALTVPAGVLAVVRELPWLGPRIADQLVGVLADSAALERLILAHAGGWAAAVATAAGNVGRNVLDAVLALLTLFFLYRDGHLLAPQIQAGLRRVGGARFAAMFDPLGRTVRAVMYGTLFTALSQGVLAMVGYWTAGLRTPVLLGAVTVLLALTPVGAALVYVSASAWLLVEGRVLAGVLLLAWGVLAVSLADNLIRSWFLRGATRVPFLLGFFGVIGGVATFGAVGLFLGPIAIALLLALWREWVAAA